MTHTPGPWNIGLPGGPAGPFWSLVNPQGMVVAMQITSEANARLIAAAPRLLEACKGLLDYVEILIKERREIGLPDDHPDFEWPSVIEAKSAIAAAEGKEK